MMDVHNNFVKSFGFQFFDYELQKRFPFTSTNALGIISVSGFPSA
jgi:hypothetical protein